MEIGYLVRLRCSWSLRLLGPVLGAPTAVGGLNLGGGSPLLSLVPEMLRFLSEDPEAQGGCVNHVGMLSWCPRALPVSDTNPINAPSFPK